MRHYQIAVLPGDGIGPEVITESVKTLETIAELHAGFHLDTQSFDSGTERYLREGSLMPKDRLAMLERGFLILSCLALLVTHGFRIT